MRIFLLVFLLTLCIGSALASGGARCDTDSDCQRLCPKGSKTCTGGPYD